MSAHNSIFEQNRTESKRKRQEEWDLPVQFEDISVAHFRIRDGIIKTPLMFSENLTKETGYNLYVKLDHGQHTGSFKERGALNALLQLTPEQRKAGVIAASAGNHALGLAYHGGRLGIPTTVVMPRVAPMTKISKCEALGANVILKGDTFDEAKNFAYQMSDEKHMTYVHGFDDPAVIAGAGTLGLEIMEQLPDLDAVIVPIGGAGLIAGLGTAVKKLKPNVEVIGVEPSLAASFTAALKAGHPVEIPLKQTLADGLCVAQVGSNAFAVAKKYTDRVLTVSERNIALAILRLVEREKTVVEGAGAAGLAAILSGQLSDLKGKKVVLLLCGGNIDTGVLGRVIERGMAADGRLIKFEAAVADRPGGLAGLTKVLAEVGASVKDMYHERAFLNRDMQTVLVRCVVETRDSAHAASVLERLKTEGYLLDDDPAKSYAVGGEVTYVIKTTDSNLPAIATSPVASSAPSTAPGPSTPAPGPSTPAPGPSTPAPAPSTAPSTPTNGNKKAKK